jgi:crotonobetainyl-CoA hydratase
MSGPDRGTSALDRGDGAALTTSREGRHASVRYEVSEFVARVTLARPEVMNAIDLATEAELQRIWRDIEQRDDVRVVVLTGEGERAFCAGADMKNPSVKGVDYWAAAREGGFGGLALRETLDVPVIARVNGFALGGGFEMVLGCDIVVACEEASFGLPEARVGRMPLDGGMTLLQRQIPFRQAMGIMLTGERFTAARALELGLINEVVARGELDTAVDRWVRKILECAPLSLRAIKQVVRRTSTLSPAQAQAVRLPAVMAALQSQDAEEGVLAFQQKRKPVWSGR